MTTSQISYLSDMDGVLIKEGEMIPGADRFLAALEENGVEFMVLTNNSIQTPRDLSARLRSQGLDIPPERIWTSATATSDFLRRQSDHGTAYVVGEAGLTTGIHEAGWILTDTDPEFVVLEETRTYSFEAITTAINLITAGARFICTNPDVTGPAPQGILPATGSVAALITAATGREPYYIGKPNPIMMRSALNTIGAHSERTVMISDRMDTDVKSGLEAGMRTVLVRSGISDDAEINRYPYRPTVVIDSVAELAERWDDPFGDGAFFNDFPQG
ncbi:HAD family hydrolase [Corynebacterium atypicum]|uniref:HAD family hydrolase n=1 Tax=Corynebacterium atypicum TaxID=191610 RepID=A0ABN4DE16_9CORY|nr:HAD-IIA family hydrolase [Corynebacterium atypicum]AIG64487.1 HAD family hydrolase [Corynebacterium atypicum]